MPTVPVAVVRDSDSSNFDFWRILGPRKMFRPRHLGECLSATKKIIAIFSIIVGNFPLVISVRKIEKVSFHFGGVQKVN